MPVTRTGVTEGTRVHDLKCWPKPFDAVAGGLKPFEIRRDDRGFRVGDALHLHRWNPETREFTGEQIVTLVTYTTKVRYWDGIADPLTIVLGLGEIFVLEPHECTTYRPLETKRCAQET